MFNFVEMKKNIRLRHNKDKGSKKAEYVLIYILCMFLVVSWRMSCSRIIFGFLQICSVIWASLLNTHYNLFHYLACAIYIIYAVLVISILPFIQNHKLYLAVSILDLKQLNNIYQHFFSFWCSPFVLLLRTQSFL